MHYCNFYTGAGIYVTYSLGTGTSVNSQTAQPNNSYAIVDTAGSNRGSYTRFEMYCCSNSSSSRATFTLPNNVVISSNYGNIRYRRYTGSNTYAGCARFYYYYYPYDNFYLDYTGIYTCNIGDSRGNNIAVSIGLYSEGFNSESLDNDGDRWVHELVGYIATTYIIMMMVSD